MKATDRSLLSLFTGAGGLDLGLETAGFRIALCVERDRWARETLMARGSRRRPWPISRFCDIHAAPPKALLREAGLSRRELTLLAGGPPCQPFSKAGRWARGTTLRLADPRAQTLRAFFEIAKAALPQVVLLENVAAMISRGSDDVGGLLDEAFEELNRARGARYEPQVLRINAAHYGVPQIRERIFVVAHRGGRKLELPSPTHLPPEQAKVLGREPYRTAWDAIGDLDSPVFEPELLPRGRFASLLPSIPEGHNYLWHTSKGGGFPLFGWRTRYWTFLLKLAKSRPSWTIAAQPGPSCGPFHWRSRQLTARELCRLQAFPDDFEVCGPRREQIRQIGNAVPPLLAELLGLEIRRQLLGEIPVRRTCKLAIASRADCPEPEPVRPVATEHLRRVGAHQPHPGSGKGPGAIDRARA